MASTFFGLNIAGSGLRAANAALNTTANNVANSETDGYSRQKIVQQAAGAIRTFTTYGCAGAGVETLAIERVRDAFYDEKFRSNATKLGEYDRKQYYMGIVENYFNDDGKTGFSSIFDQIQSSLEEVVKNPSDASTKAQFISSCKQLTDYFNNMAGDLHDIQADVNDEIRIQINEINTAAQELAAINKQINVIEMGGTKANELRDTRDKILDNLSAIVDVEMTEVPIYDSNNNATGGTRCLVRIAGGHTLVDADSARQLVTVARKDYEKVNQTDMDGLYDIYWNDQTEFSLANASLGGALKGLVDLRDGNNGEYFHGKVTSTNTLADGLQTVTIAADGLNWGDMSKCNLSDTGGKIVINNQVFWYKDWTFQKDAATGNGIYTFTMDPTMNEASVNGLPNGAAAKIGTETAYQGIPYYMSQMNEWVRDFAKAVNEIFSGGVTTDGSDAGILFTGTSLNKGQYVEDQFLDYQKDPSTGAEQGDATGKGYYRVTAKNFSIVDALLVDSTLLGVKKDPSAGAEEAEQAKLVKDVLSNKDAFGFRGGDAKNFLACILSDAALNASNANTFYKSYKSLENSIDNQRNSIFGVDQDEEAVAMVKYQNSYTLASKMISTLQEVYDRLILQTGV